MGQDSLEEREMRAAFEEQVRKVVASPARFVKDRTTLRVGLESEVAVHKRYQPPLQLGALRDTIIKESGDIADVELGAAQLELRTPPIDILTPTGLFDLFASYRSQFVLVVKAARKKGASILRIGSNPFLPIKNTPRTDTPKYRIVPDYYNTHRPKEADTLIGLGQHRIDIGDAAIVSLFQSFQVNLEARSLGDACDKMNRSFFIAPYLLALGANARYLECLDTKIQDMRMIAWEKSHDTRMQDVRLLAWEKSFDIRTPEEIARGTMLRVGLPERYFFDVRDYLARSGRFPFILYQPDAAFKIAVGMTWLDARVKFIGDSAVVELRLLPTQPTVEEELLLTLLYIGRLVDSQVRREVLMPIEHVRENRLSAMLYGMHRDMWFLTDDGASEKLPYRIGMNREIRRARGGLKRLGIEGWFNVDLLAEILWRGSPSDRLAGVLEDIVDGTPTERMERALRALGMLVESVEDDDEGTGGEW